MATELAKAYVQIIPSAQGISSGVESALTGDLEKVGDSAGKNFGGKFLKVGAGVIAAGTAAVGAAAGAVWSAVNKTAELGDEIDKTSQKIGVSAEQYQALAFAAEHSGFEVSTFQTAAKNLANTDFDGNVADAINSIMELDDVSERTAMATELFGAKAAQSMAALLNGSDDVEDYKNQLEAIGGLMSDDAVKSSAAFEDSLTNLKTSFQGLGNGLMSDFMPSITTTMDGLTMLMSGDKEGGLAKINEGINSFLDNLEASIPVIIDTGGEIVMSLLDALIENLPQIIEMGIEIIMKLIVGILQAIPKLVVKIPDIIKAVVSGLKNGWPELKNAGVDMVKGLWEGLKSATDWLKNKIKEWVGNITDFLKNLFGIHSPSTLMRDEIGKYLPSGIAVGIEANADSVRKAMSDLSDITTEAYNPSISYGRLAKDNSISAIEDLTKALNNSNTNITVKLEGDAQKLFRSTISSNNDFRKRTGISAFA